jgi:DNA-directed RNA polymerase specialized sigma24 family protein
MNEIEKFIDETIKRAARRANRRSYGGIEAGDIAGALWEKVLPLRDDAKKWNKEYLSVVIWRNAFGHHHRKVEPIPLIIEGDAQCAPLSPEYIDIHHLIAQIGDDETRAATVLYCKGNSIESIASTLHTTKPRVNNLLVSAKRQLRSSISKLPLEEQEALRDGF